MKKLFLLFTLLSYLSIPMKTAAQSFSAMTYNIRYATEKDGENQWELRKEFLAGQIRFFAPDVFGIQEGLERQVEYLDSALAHYKYVGGGRDDGKAKGEYSALYYNTQKFDLKDHSQFWLSETPKTSSKGWDAAIVRICTYAILELKESGKQIFVLNTHFDHQGELARLNSAKLILEKIEEINKDNLPVVLTGDLNLEPETEGIQLLSENLNDSYLHTEEPPFGPYGTFNGFNFDKPVTRRIDYIFVNEQLAVKKYAVLSDSNDLKYPSDHLPVFTQLYFK